MTGTSQDESQIANITIYRRVHRREREALPHARGCGRGESCGDWSDRAAIVACCAVSLSRDNQGLML